MRKTFSPLGIFFFLLLNVAISGTLSAGPAKPESPPSVRSTQSLKAFMAKFGSMLAGLEILRMKEKTPDWEAINLTLNELSQNLAEMQKADTANSYKEYTDILAAGLVELQEKAAKQDKNFFKSVDRLSDACFRCHAAHRPGDYLVPKGKQQADL